MQYILTEKEFKDLQIKAVLQSAEIKSKIQELATLAAENIILPEDHWAAGSTWGCARTKTAEYCDDCPVEKLCEYDYKIWSQ